MPVCYFCEEQSRPFFGYYCEDCAMLRRWLVTYDAKKCIDILKRTLTRDSKQIDFKINQEIKKILNKEIEDKNDEDDKNSDASYMTRSKIKK